MVTRTHSAAGHPAHVRLLALPIALLVLLAACSSTRSPSRPTGGPQVLVSGLRVPWGVAFLPDRSALVGERATARLLWINPRGQMTVLGTVPGVSAVGEGGLLGLAVSPHFSTDRLVYAYMSTVDDNRVVRFTLNDGRIGTPEPILTGIVTASNHNGGRIAFGPDGLLYVTTGDALVGTRAQNRASLNGKILRITADGKPAPGNPFPNSPVFTYGHRNVEGLAWGPGNRLYATEFGENTADEINLIRAGRNYGWPTAEGHDPQNRFAQPLITWPTSAASPSGVAYGHSALWVGALRGGRLWRIPVHADGTLGRPAALLAGQYGRIRTVALTPDGSLWLTTSNRDGRGSVTAADDRIIRLPLR